MKGLKCEVLGIVVIFLVIIFDISLFGEENDFFDLAATNFKCNTRSACPVRLGRPKRDGPNRTTQSHAIPRLRT